MSDPCPRCPCPDRCLRWPAFCAWAAEDPPNGTNLRHICARSGGVETSYPPLVMQAANLGRALWDWATSGFTMASDAEVGRRLEICSGCEHWDKEWRRCKICGCFTDAKIRLKTEHCPLPEPKW